MGAGGGVGGAADATGKRGGGGRVRAGGWTLGDAWGWWRGARRASRKPGRGAGPLDGVPGVLCAGRRARHVALVGLAWRVGRWPPTPGTTMPEETIDPGLLEQTKNQIRKLVAEIADLAESDIQPAEFYVEFLNRAVA